MLTKLNVLIPEEINQLLTNLCKEKDRSVRQGKCIKIQLVKIQPMQRLTTSIEAIIALREVTNVMKPIKATY